MTSPATTRKNRRFTPLGLLGLAGTIGWLGVFAAFPSFPTPDKLIVLLFFIGLALGQAVRFLTLFGPFAGLLLLYDSLRSLLPGLHQRVNFDLLPTIDRWLGGGRLLSVRLQQWLWRGHLLWYDYLFYAVYMLHFVMPFGLAYLIWRRRPAYYWQTVTAYLLLSFMGFFSYLVFPAAPPWMASEAAMIEPVTRISSRVWAAFGITDFPSLYQRLSPNPVAPFPSLHAAYAVLFALIVWRRFGRRPGLAAALFPGLVVFGTVYQGEHYLIDALAGAVYAAVAYALAAPFLGLIKKPVRLVAAKVRWVQRQPLIQKAAGICVDRQSCD